MEKMIAFCGIICSECPALVATQENDNEKRKQVAELWSKMYNSDIKSEEINCNGCMAKSGRLFRYCNVCEIRKCGQERHLKNCAYCEDYICEKLSSFFKMAGPDPKYNLEEIRKML